MSRQRLLLTSMLATVLGLVVACGGGGGAKGKKVEEPSSSAQPSRKDTADTRAQARAKAGAEAHAKNEANRKAYEEHIEQLKAGFRQLQDKYEADHDSFRKADAIYQPAKAEYDAARKLVLARGLYDDSKTAKGSQAMTKLEAAQDRFREIIYLAEDLRKKYVGKHSGAVVIGIWDSERVCRNFEDLPEDEAYLHFLAEVQIVGKKDKGHISWSGKGRNH